MRMRELRRKEVINVSDGGRLGFVGDVELHLPFRCFSAPAALPY